MGIKLVTPMSEIDYYFKNKIEEIENKTIRIFKYIGEACIIEARTNGNYQDQTGNLRSSIGYLIVKDGSIVDRAIYESNNGTDRKTGLSQGESYMKKIASDFPSDIVLVVVAGMNYAGYVSAMGRNVLDSAELLAKELVPKLLKEVGFKQ